MELIRIILLNCNIFKNEIKYTLNDMKYHKQLIVLKSALIKKIKLYFYFLHYRHFYETSILNNVKKFIKIL